MLRIYVIGGETVIKMTKIQSAVLSAIVLTIVNILWSIAADVVKPHIMPYIVKETQSHGNLDRKRWSLEIPYEVDGVVTSMFPDLIVVRADAHGYVFDVLEPHDSSRKDNYPKAVGLAKFAEKHGEHFGRIQLIRKAKGADKRDHFYRLDMGKLSVRNRVRGVTSNAELDRIFNEDAQTEE